MFRRYILVYKRTDDHGCAETAEEVQEEGVAAILQDLLPQDQSSEDACHIEARDREVESKRPLNILGVPIADFPTVKPKSKQSDASNCQNFFPRVRGPDLDIHGVWQVHHDLDLAKKALSEVSGLFKNKSIYDRARVKEDESEGRKAMIFRASSCFELAKKKLPRVNAAKKTFGTYPQIPSALQDVATELKKLQSIGENSELQYVQIFKEEKGMSLEMHLDDANTQGDVVAWLL